MITTTLPTINKQLDGGTIKVTEKEITIRVDTSIFAEERWEENFPRLAERETLFAYTERISDIAKGGKPSLIAQLKALYCFIDSEEIGDFKQFCQMFEISEQDYLDRLVKRITEVFNLALTSSMTTQKN